jgi:hypothetical protein
MKTAARSCQKRFCQSAESRSEVTDMGRHVSVPDFIAKAESCAAFLRWHHAPTGMINDTAQSEIDWLYSTQLFGIKLGLDNVQRLLRELNLPAAGQKFIHVAGRTAKAPPAPSCIRF